LSWFGTGWIDRWQANCLLNDRQNLVALKRNDEYALVIKGAADYKGRAV
jgi:hypothetical protein